MPDKRERKGNPVHHLAYVSVEDDGMAGRRPLWGYGPFHVAALADRSRRTVRKVTAAGVIPLHIPAEAVAWALDRRASRSSRTRCWRASDTGLGTRSQKSERGRLRMRWRPV